LADAVIDGKTGRGETKGEEPAAARAEKPRRSARSQFRADDAPAEAPIAAPETSAAPPADTAPAEPAAAETLAAQTG
jgi:hypothetical protein